MIPKPGAAVGLPEFLKEYAWKTALKSWDIVELIKKPSF